MIVVGVDTGGTFTDFIYMDGSAVGVHKTLSTPDDPSRAVLAGLSHIADELGLGPDADLFVVHGSTVATNAILERKGVKTGLVTNAGFEDVLEIGRQNRTRLYDLAYRREPPLVPAELRFGLDCRVTSDGRVEKEPNNNEISELAKHLSNHGVQSVAVSLLFSFLHPEHEQRMGEALRAAGLAVSLSHEILAEFREYERTSTTVVNAYVSPIMTRYLTSLMDGLEGRTLRIMQSNGGSISAQTAMRESVRTILSGPAGGAVGALELGRLAGAERLITFDMGGTSTDVALMDRKLPLVMESSIGEHPVKVPMIDIHTVGAGGGSMAGIDPGGALTVGPESAGADPGPACYGRGNERVTVTDANLYLGRLVPGEFLGGRMDLDVAAAKRAVETLAGELGLSPRETAEGVLAVVNANMERAVRVISVERGFDPREFTLFSFGGAGGLHCVELARLLSMDQVLVPANAGILSAVGMLLADVVKDYSRTVMLPLAEVDPAELDGWFAELEERGSRALVREGVPPERMVHERFLDMRYQGQSFEIVVPMADRTLHDMGEGFEALHQARYGHRNAGKGVEVVNIRLRSRGSQPGREFPRGQMAGETPPPETLRGERDVVFAGREHRARIVDRAALLSGNVIPGPAVITEYTSTIVVPPGAIARVDEYFNLRITVGGAGE